MSAREIIWHGILMIRNICNPIVTIYVVNAKQVEAVNAHPHISEEAFAVTFAVVEEFVAHADVGAFVGRSPKRVAFELSVRSREGQSVGLGQFQAHSPTGGSREIIGKIEV